MTEFNYYAKCDCCGSMFKDTELQQLEVESKEFDGAACTLCHAELLGWIDVRGLPAVDVEALSQAHNKIFGDELLYEQIEEMFDENNLVIFPSYYDYFVWQHKECSKETLIKMLYDNYNYAEDVIKLSYGRVASFL